jgi:hypothetical protein
MVFIYLPFYFGIGVILFFVWHLAVLSWKRYGPPGRAPAGREVDAGAPGAPARAGSAAGVLAVCFIAAAVTGLVGFAIGRATLPQGIFISDFPDGWGPIGFEIPAIVVGALAAAFFTGAVASLPTPAQRRALTEGGCDLKPVAHCWSRQPLCF